MILEMLSNLNDNNWERPIILLQQSLLHYIELTGYQLSLNGLTFQVVPGSPLNNGVNIDVAYETMVNKFRWGG